MIKRFYWNTLLDKLDKKYTLYLINRKYKDTHFKSLEEYSDCQHKLAGEIDELTAEAKEKISDLLKNSFPEAEILIYDSSSCIKADSKLGRILVKGLKSRADGADMQSVFEQLTSMKMSVERIEDLPNGQQSEILEFVN